MPAFNPKAVALSHVTMGAPDPAATVAHYRDVLGLHVTDAQDGATYLSLSGAHHEIVIQKADDKTFVHQGYQLRPDVDLDGFAAELKAHGLAPELKSDSQPGMARLLEVAAPGGVVFQFFHEMETGVPPKSMSGISPLRLGHIAILSPEAPKLVDFYRDVLGFHYTDDIGGLAYFLTCNRDHHVVNVVGIPESRIHHIAFELRDGSDHVRAADLLSRADCPTIWGPSRHGAGHNLAGYHYDPDRVMIEFYTQMDVYLPALGYHEPRPWHDEFPMKPKSWPLEAMTIWNTDYGFNLAMA